MVVGGAGDCAAGAVGNGIVSRGVLSTSIGTSGVMFVHSDEVKIDPPGRLHTFCHAVHGKWHMMGVSLSAGGSCNGSATQLCQAEIAAAKQRRSIPTTCSTAEAGRDRRRAARACSSCRICPASARRTPIPTPAAASSA